ncbi:hypothetical protein GUITHDRAFT_62784, partial [Guillardia theta CCMP2712]
ALTTLPLSQDSYIPFCDDFGPLNLGTVYKFCRTMEGLLQRPDWLRHKLIYFCPLHPRVCTNAAFLLSCYMLLCRGASAKEAVAPFADIQPRPFLPYRDATFVRSDFDLEFESCVKGVDKAARNGWFSMSKFDLIRYDKLSDPLFADLHELCHKFVAFKGPVQQGEGVFDHRPNKFVSIFKELRVTAVVRLNEVRYSSKIFTDNGIRHYDLFFEDCSVPPPNIISSFFDICDRERRVAVHCFAGLGRTGTLIALWMMRHHGMSADEAMGWLRVVRPGCVIGEQQHFLKSCEHMQWQGNYCATPEARKSSWRQSMCAKQLKEAMSNKRRARQQ